MTTRAASLSLAVLLALSAGGTAHAQSKARTEALPVWNQSSGKLEAVLFLEPTTSAPAGARWKVGRTTLDGAFGLDDGRLGLVCARKNGLAGAIGNLVDNCMLAALDDNARAVSAGAALSRSGHRVGLNLGASRDTLPTWLSPTGRPNKVDQNALTVFGQTGIGREATVSIAGTVARARLVPAGDVPDSVTDRWTTSSVTVGAGYGPFGANVIGRVVDAPNVAGRWEGFGLGLTWRTPWSGQLTVGADNVVTRGRNPFSPAGAADKDEGTVPYVRYEQDL